MDAGLLSSIQLTDALIDSVERSEDPYLREALGLILGGIAMKRGVTGDIRYLGSRPDIETVLRIANHLQVRSTHPLSGYVSGWSPSVERLSPSGDDGQVFRRLLGCARDVLKEKLATPADTAKLKYLSGLCNLARPWISNGQYEVLPKIFTLNYDLCLEEALAYDGKLFTTGFQEGLWTPDKFNNHDVTRIYKLHGSFGWVRHPEKFLLYDRAGALGRTDIEFDSNDIDDEIIFATEHKLQALHPYLWMVYQFWEAAAEAKYIVTIGYGYGDEYVNQILAQALARDAKKRLLVVSPRFDPSRLENAAGITYYTERIVPVLCGAKKALFEDDAVLKKLRELEEETESDAPF